MNFYATLCPHFVLMYVVCHVCRYAAEVEVWEGVGGVEVEEAEVLSSNIHQQGACLTVGSET